MPANFRDIFDWTLLLQLSRDVCDISQNVYRKCIRNFTNWHTQTVTFEFGAWQKHTDRFLKRISKMNHNVSLAKFGVDETENGTCIHNVGTYPTVDIAVWLPLSPHTVMNIARADCWFFAVFMYFLGHRHRNGPRTNAALRPACCVAAQ